jgi:protein-tyrosine phosphatase
MREDDGRKHGPFRGLVSLQIPIDGGAGWDYDYHPFIPADRFRKRVPMNLSQVLPQLFVGSCPASADDINHLKTDYGVTAILNLQTDHDFDYWDLNWSRIEGRCRELGVEVRRIPVRDFDGLDLRKKLSQCVETLDELLRGGHTVYTHCNVGSGRSPSVAIAYLVWRQGWNLDDAIEHVTRGRSCSPNIDAIVLAGGERAAA